MSSSESKKSQYSNSSISEKSCYSSNSESSQMYAKEFHKQRTLPIFQKNYFENIKINNSEFKIKPKQSLIMLNTNFKSMKLYNKPIYRKFKKSPFTDKKNRSIKSGTSFKCFNYKISGDEIIEEDEENDKIIDEEMIIGDFNISGYDAKSYITPPKILKQINNFDLIADFEGKKKKSFKNQDKISEQTISTFSLK